MLACGFVVASACVAWDYGKALDQCAFDHAGDPAGRAQCQCDVSMDAGRSCAWIDGGDGGWLPEASAQDAGAQ